MLHCLVFPIIQHVQQIAIYSLKLGQERGKVSTKREKEFPFSGLEEHEQNQASFHLLIFQVRAVLKLYF